MFKIPKPTLRSMGTGKKRVKYPVFNRSLRLLSAIMVSTMLSMIVTPYYTLVAQPNVPVLPTPNFKATDFNPYLDQANAGRSQTGWESIIESGRLTLLAQWETQVDALVNSMVSGVTTSDSVITVDEYKKFVRESLESQKKEALANWELQADQLIQVERASYSTDLGKLNMTESKDGTDDSLKNALNKSETDCVNCDSNLKVRSENQALDYASFIFDSAKEQVELNRLTWEKDMRDQTETGLYQFQQARLALDKNHADFNKALDQTDQAFRDNIALFESYEQKVRAQITNTVAGLEGYLNSTGLFHNESCNGDNVCTKDMSSLNASGQNFQNVLNDIKNGLSNNTPLSTLVVTLRDYMATRKTEAETKRTYWADKVTGTGHFNDVSAKSYGKDHFDDSVTFANIGASNYSPPAVTPSWWNDSNLTASQIKDRDNVKSLVNYIDNGGNSNIEAMLRRNGDHRTVTGVSQADVCGNSGGGESWSHTCYSSYGNGAFHYTTVESTFYLLATDYDFYSNHETSLDIKLTYNWKDPNAENNRNTWQGYVDNLSSQLDSWSNDIVPAILNWEEQVTDYKTRYSDWKVEETKQRQEAETKYTTARTALINEQNTWLNEMQKSYSSGQNRYRAISQALEVKRSQETDGTREHFNTENMTREKLNELIAGIVREVTESVPGDLPGVPDLPKADIIAAAGMVEAKSDFLSASQENLPDPNQLQTVANAFQQSLTGMMNYVLADTLNTMATGAREKTIERTVRMAEGMGFTTTTANDGTVTATRTIHSGVATLIEEAPGTAEEDYYPETEDQVLSLGPPQAVELAATGNLFSQWDTSNILNEFGDNMKENSENQAAGGSSDILRSANDVAQAKKESYETDRQNKIEQAERDATFDEVMGYIKIGLSVLSMVPGIGQFAMAALVVVSFAEGYAEGGIVGALTGAVSGVVGGYAERAGMQFDIGYSYEDGFSGSIGGGFKGVGGSIGWDESGVNEFSAGVNFKGVEAGVTYDTDDGWGAEVGYSRGGLELGLAYNESDGFGVNAGYSKGGIDLGVGWNESDGFGLEAGYSKGGFDLGVSYNQNDGFATEAGYSKGGLDLGLSYSEADGFATEAGYSKGGFDVGLGYSEADGFSTEVGYSGGGLDIGLGYNEADGFNTEVAYSNGGLDVSLGYSETDGFGTELAYSNGGLDLGLSYSENDGFATEAAYSNGGLTVGVAYSDADGFSADGSYTADGVDIALGYNEQDGVSADASLSKNGVDISLGYNEQDGFGTELAYSGNGLDVSVGYSESEGLATGLSYEKDGVSLDLAYSDADGFGASAGYESNGLTVGVGYTSADGVTANAAYENGGLNLAAGYGADGFSANAAYENGGLTLAAGYDADGITADAGFEKNGITVGLGYASGDGITGSAGYKGVVASLNYNNGGISGDVDFSKGDFGTALALNQDDVQGDALIPAEDITSGLGASSDDKLSLSNVNLDSLRKSMEAKKNAFVELAKDKAKEVVKDKTEELKSQTQDLMKLK